MATARVLLGAVFSVGVHAMYVGTWPKGGDGKPLPCTYHTVLEDSAAGWPGQCLGLAKDTSKATFTVQECQALCYNNPLCSVYQVTNGDKPDECYIGGDGAFAYNCYDGDASRPWTPKGAQRVQHGDVKVIKDLNSEWVTDADGTTLYNAGLESSNGTMDTARCKEKCYSDIACRYWQYGTDGCWVESKGYEIDSPVLSNTTTMARTMKQGQIIEHVCIPPTKPKPSNLWAKILAAVGGLLLLLCCIGAIYYLCCKPKASKPKKTRQVKVMPKAAPKEEVLLQPTYVTYQSYAPVPTVAPPVVSSVVMAPTPAVGSVVMPPAMPPAGSVAMAPAMPQAGSVMMAPAGGPVLAKESVLVR